MRGVLPPQMGVVGVQPTAGGFDEVHLSSSHELFPEAIRLHLVFAVF